MEIDKNVKLNGGPKSGLGQPRKYHFDRVNHGDSMHVQTEMQAISIFSSFRHFKSRNNTSLKCTRRAVDHTDPKGPGYRVWFLDPERCNEI